MIRSNSAASVAPKPLIPNRFLPSYGIHVWLGLPSACRIGPNSQRSAFRRQGVESPAPVLRGPHSLHFRSANGWACSSPTLSQKTHSTTSSPRRPPMNRPWHRTNFHPRIHKSSLNVPPRGPLKEHFGNRLVRRSPRRVKIFTRAVNSCSDIS
jgi:hypothetical protein